MQTKRKFQPASLHRVSSTIDDLRFDSSRGIIEWTEPVGSVSPYEITVSSASLSGQEIVSSDG